VLRDFFDQARARPDQSFRIEGNCDERGSEQYNLALGQRRADAAKRYLTSMGAHDKQLTAISFGAEKPTCACGRS